MSVSTPEALPAETVVHRIGGGGVEQLRLKPKEKTPTPPGISLLLGGTPAPAAEQMRQAFPDRDKFARIRELAEAVGSATVASIRAAGFEVIADRSANHARLTHPDGVAGFVDAHLERRSRVFQDTPTLKG